MENMQSYLGDEPKEYKLDTTGLSNIQFGHELKVKEFLLRPDMIFLNHGSYGTVPKRLLDIQAKYNIEREMHADLWFRLNATIYVDRAREAVADFVGADVENLVFVDNASTAVNTVVRSYPFKSGDALLDTTFTYGSIMNLFCDFTSRIRPDVERVKLELTFPIQSEDDILEKYEEIFQQKPNIKFVIIDHITSPTAIVMPVKKLVRLCHNHGAFVMIDGAHTIGQLPLDMKDIGADAYTSNLHKWCYCPRGAAYLWFQAECASWIYPPCTSWELGEAVPKQFYDQGARDHVPFICALHALEFYKAIGGMDKIVTYTRNLADAAKDMLTKEGLEHLAMPESLESPNMRLVKLPLFPKYPVSEDNLWVLQDAIFGKAKMFGILSIVEKDFYFRYSVQVYNDMEDMRAMVKVLKDFVKANV